MIAKFIQDTKGATAIEYGLIVIMLSLVIISALSLVTDVLKFEYTYLNSKTN